MAGQPCKHTTGLGLSVSALIVGQCGKVVWSNECSVNRDSGEHGKWERIVKAISWALGTAFSATRLPSIILMNRDPKPEKTGVTGIGVNSRRSSDIVYG